MRRDVSEENKFWFADKFFKMKRVPVNHAGRSFKYLFRP
ncbi:hypothetical protein MmTuc01_1692 [Methanosarcina mazei Tuc01]|uniref:Uncharacterized protein n=1 Tax=Methanosarcina mazei Tuc01 TaxID=1236903 RepID=M1PXN8_METMZ|nr:hypothetical protein MmTuc01_1692 [Methanosarcina mazei Tuc01]